jgi:hypothetical protein
VSTVIETPRFDLPFRIGQQGAAVVEQDTLDDVANCVVVVLSCPRGWREEAPNFGVPDFAFKRQPIGTEQINSLVSSQEPRAVLVVNERPDLYDELIDRINIGVSTHLKVGTP